LLRINNNEKVTIECPIEKVSHAYAKPAAMIENQGGDDFNNFNDFLEIVLPVDLELFNDICKFLIKSLIHTKIKFSKICI
jgi:hypothetical protein